MELIQEACKALSALNEGKIAFNTLMKDEALLASVRKSVGDRKLKSADRRIETEEGNVLLSDLLSAIIYLDRGTFQGEQSDFDFKGSDLIEGKDVVVMHALGGDYTLEELVTLADAYAFRKQRFKVEASPVESKGDKLAGVESGTSIEITINGLRKITFQLYPSEVEKLISALK